VVKGADATSHCRGAGCVSTPPRLARCPINTWAGLAGEPSAAFAILITATMAGKPGRVRAGPVTARCLPDAWNQVSGRNREHSLRGGFGRVLRHAPRWEGHHRSMAWLWQWFLELAFARGFAERHGSRPAGDRVAPGAPERAATGPVSSEMTMHRHGKAIGGCPSPAGGGCHNGQSLRDREGSPRPRGCGALPSTAPSCRGVSAQPG